jgi:hypothetical protein
MSKMEKEKVSLKSSPPLHVYIYIERERERERSFSPFSPKIPLYPTPSSQMPKPTRSSTPAQDPSKPSLEYT